MSSNIIKFAKQTLQSSTNKTAKQLLLRDFIYDRLYEPGGYFTQEAHQVGKLREPIKFSKLRGYHDFREEMARLYPENAWVTPCELFKPYYGYTVANFILNQMETMRSKKLKVLEIGPGTGSFADSLLEFFKNYNLDLYRECEYVFVEISPQLAASCEDLMRQKHKALLDKGNIKIFNGSIQEFPKRINQHCFVVALEVLDNLVHDRLFEEEGKLKYQAEVKISFDAEGNEVLDEIKTPISDELCQLYVDLLEKQPPMDHIDAQKAMKQEGLFKRLSNMLDFAKHKDSMTNNTFIPTGALSMFKHLKKQIPDHSVIMADFDSFIMPKNSIRGVNAPLVTHKLKDPTKWITYDNYLIPRGHADICFPVDFHFLKYAYEQITDKPATVYKNKEFIDLFALESWCTTQNLYSPLRESYFNTSLLVTEFKKNQRH